MSRQISAMVTSSDSFPDTGDGHEPVTGPGERGDLIVSIALGLVHGHTGFQLLGSVVALVQS
jgi:hypothetical protein